MSGNEQQSIWLVQGKDKNYEHYRTSNSESSQVLRKWVDEAYYENNLAQYLDKDFVKTFRNEHFYARLWELELAEWLVKTGLKLVPTNGTGPDFCIELDDGTKIWIEAVLSQADEELEQIQRDALASNGSQTYDTPRNQTALRYSSSLVYKADKIKKNYSTLIGKNDYVLIAVSAFAPGAMRSDIDLFMLAVLPIEYQVVHFSTDGRPLPDVPRPTHTVKREHAKKSGALVKKEFLYPGEDFPHINGILFSEASNLQQLLGTYSSSFGTTTDTPHVFQSYQSKDLPKEFTSTFYYHKFNNNGDMVSLEQISPANSDE